MVESHFRINFAYTEGSALSKLHDFLDSADDLEYTSLTEQEVVLGGELMSVGLRANSDAERIYDYDTALITMSIPSERLVRPNGDERLDSAVSFVPRVYAETDPQYVFGMHTWRIERIDKDYLDHSIPSPVGDDTLSQNRIGHPTWLMLFPPTLVEEYGRDWLLDLPAERIEELDDGAIMTVATEDVTEGESDTEIAQLVDEAMEPIEAAFDSFDP